MQLQRAGFTFHVPNQRELTREMNKTLKKFLIPRDAKEHLRNQLPSLGVDDFSVYGDLDSLARQLKASHGIR